MISNDKIVGRPIRINRVTLHSRKKEYAEVVFFGDYHYGSKECDIERGKKMLNYCLKKNIYVFLMGDILENATRYSVGSGVYEQLINPDRQLDEIIQLLEPLAKKGLIIGNLLGNHEERTYKDSGVNPTRLISKFLKIPYLGYACWSIFKVGNQSYKIYTLHGASSARFSYTKLKSLVDISHSFDADLIAMGHVHEQITDSQVVQFIDKGVLKEKKKILLITGHYLKYEGGYAQAKGYPIAKGGSPKVKFFANKHDIHVSF